MIFFNDRQSGLLLFVPAVYTSFHIHASILTFVIGFVILYHACCSHPRVFGKTLVHEFSISYSHTEWYLCCVARRNSPCLGRSFAYQNLIKLTNLMSVKWRLIMFLCNNFSLFLIDMNDYQCDEQIDCNVFNKIYSKFII